MCFCADPRHNRKMRTRSLLIGAGVLAACAAGAAGARLMSRAHDDALAPLLREAEALVDGSSGCPAAADALPLIERIAVQAQGLEPGAAQSALSHAGRDLLAPAVHCQLWIRAQALTFDETEISPGALTRRVAAALSFEQARARYIAASNADEASARAALTAVYESSFAAPPAAAVLEQAAASRRPTSTACPPLTAPSSPRPWPPVPLASAAACVHAAACAAPASATCPRSLRRCAPNTSTPIPSSRCWQDAHITTTRELFHDD
jgi:hypothetical protein